MTPTYVTPKVFTGLCASGSALQVSSGVRCVGSFPTPRCASYRKWDPPSLIPSRALIATPCSGSPAISPPNTTHPYVS